MSFSNPVPIAVALVPYQGKFLGIRRAIEPQIGQVAFPGGYINTGETFQQALSRELLEETGVVVAEDAWSVFHVGDALQSNRILVFGICKGVDQVNFNFKSAETQEVTLIEATTHLAFPLHNEAKDKFYSRV